MMSKNSLVEKIQVCLRICATGVLVMTVLVVGLDSQTKLLFGVYKKKVTFKVLNALWVLMYVHSVAAVYNLLQLGRFFIPFFRSDNTKKPNLIVLWGSFLLDQAGVYIVYTATNALMAVSVVALTGAEEFQWIKACDKYTKFCIQIAGALFCSFSAFLLMLVISFISSFHLFRVYSPKHLLQLKPF